METKRTKEDLDLINAVALRAILDITEARASIEQSEYILDTVEDGTGFPMNDKDLRALKKGLRQDYAKIEDAIANLGRLA